MGILDSPEQQTKLAGARNSSTTCYAISAKIRNMLQMPDFIGCLQFFAF
jgi:hypothetical protein